MKNVVNNIAKKIPKEIEVEKMSGVDIFWIKFWRIACVFLMVSITTIASCEYSVTKQKNAAIVKLVELGNSPEAARCAINGTDGTESTKVQCAIHYAKKN